MEFAISSSSLDLSNLCFEGLWCNTANLRFAKPFLGFGFLAKNENAQEYFCNFKRMVISSQLMPGHTEGSFMGNKRLQDHSRKLEFVRTLLIDNYDSYTYNIYQELSVVNGGICLRLLLECRDIPILGVCLGHLALGYVHGAQIVHAPETVHGRMSEIEHDGCRLFNNIPSGKKSGFKVVRYHSLIIDARSLPKELVPIAWTSSTGTHSFLESQNSDFIPDACESQVRPTICFDTYSPKLNNGTSWSFSHSTEVRRGKNLMGIMHSTRPHYGIQFHPESIATCHGRKIFENFREMTRDYWHRLRSTFVNERHAFYTACMQLPGAIQLFGVPRTGPLECNEDALPFREASRRRQLLGNIDENNCFNMSSLLKFPKSNVHVKHLKLKWRKFDRLAAQLGGARNIFSELFGANRAENTFWLDSSSVEKGRARFSFMGGKGGSLWKQITFRLSDQSDMAFKSGGFLSIEYAPGATKSMYLKKELLSFHYDEKDFEGLPFDFYGGYIGYNLKIECGMLANCYKSKTPDACFFFADNFVVIDHLYDDVYIMSIQEGSTTDTPWLDDVQQKLLRLEASAASKLEKQTSQPSTFFPCTAGFLAGKSREQCINDVQKSLEYIKDGESYELCLTAQIRKRVGDIESLGLYLQLREKNPAPYAAWLNFSNENLCICCSSPERFLGLDRNSVLEAKPIKGTIARGRTHEEDEQLKLQLQCSEKDQAENLMIVDLLRNDLGRVCEPGSVHVQRLIDVESYATVHTMVSKIRGKKRSNINAADCIRAAFPDGSMTGAPKLRSMELLHSLESCSRGIYSGSIGFFSYNQTFDLNIVIRTIVIHEGEASIGAGGAIVALSNPEDEYDEMILKTGAPAKAVVEFQ
ncbi:hypothetical protein GH714_034037 [Hevea brasiliensis]|uniref:aminodeoxychorismate synthase n=1 Tax=Hevea brasiliensis TaxID=3981 RepID=A0A6A6L853_HEVBR|nr:hypothetical protein GH714_034037 [Hevea brasiliensis]